MDETKNSEKLLDNPLDKPELSGVTPTRPFLIKEEFTKTITREELNNVFGHRVENSGTTTHHSPATNTTPITEADKKFEWGDHSLLEQESPKDPSTVVNQETDKSKWTVGKILLGLALALLLILIGLYILGGDIKDGSVSPAPENTLQ